MNIIKKISRIPANANIAYLIKDIKLLSDITLTKQEALIVKNQKSITEKNFIPVFRPKDSIFLAFPKDDKSKENYPESYRILGDRFQGLLNDNKIESIVIVNLSYSKNETLAFLEGLVLGNYQFSKYKKSDDKKGLNSLCEMSVFSKDIREQDIDELNIIIDAVYKCRDLINEPVSYLNALKLSEIITDMGRETGMKVEVLNKKKIESLKMGGLLAVNKGSVDPPTFTIIEWKPEKAVNKKPYILVGKGIVFDSGGMNIKPGPSMEDMKCDMSGAAAVASAIYAISKARLPVYVIGLIPATDNRLNGNAYVPGDVITMFDGTKVEVLNTDAEGRMILADALSYAKKYKPELVIDIATLTGAASIAIGKYGIVAMGSDSEKEYKLLEQSGENVCERLVKFPFWEEYGELIKSEVAEIKNVGGREAGAITAGKFLAKFIDYPWIHLDIAGPAFVDKRYNYRGTGGTGVGVRLFYDFIKSKCM